MFNSQASNELITTRKELSFQNKQKGKEKCAAELIIANKELLFQNKEKEKCAADLMIANKELRFENKEKEKRAVELTLANKELKKAEKSQKEYILGLKKMMYVTSHQLRQPIVQILGLSDLLETAINTPEELVEITRFMKQCAKSLDNFTRELTKVIYEQELIAKSKNQP